METMVFLVSLLLFIGMSGGIRSVKKIRGPRPNITDWRIYVETFNNFYSDLTVDNEYRRQIFEDNVQEIQEWNNEYMEGIQSYRKGINPFTAKTPEEMVRMINGVPHRPRLQKRFGYGYFNFPDDDTAIYRRKKRLPRNFDWREKGIVPAVKYQGECAACFAFVVLDSIETRYNLLYGESETLSSQMIVDCTQGENEGCEGGYLDKSFDFLLKVGGVATEEDYPYEAKVGECRQDKFELQYPIKKLVTIPEGDEKWLKKLLVLSGPIAVALDSEPDTFQKYESGIFDDPTCKNNSLEHTGLLVGYGKEDGKKFWIVKNSWSEWWGEDGYIRIRRNYKNVCGIASNAIYPII